MAAVALVDIGALDLAAGELLLSASTAMQSNAFVTTVITH
jgi:hypothetical protein